VSRPVEGDGLIDRRRLQALVEEGAQLVEVLPAEEYREDHLPGAVNHPLRKLEQEAIQIDRERPVIVYCWDAG
jgi:rhodanese-related sulfurtransferase